jgi:hypothetical protein
MRWFQAACCPLIVLALLHSLSFLTAPPPPADETEAKLQDLTRNYKKDMMGVQRSLGDLVVGFLISFSVLPLTMAPAALLVTRGDRRIARRFPAIYFIELLAMTIVSIVWWFHAPTAFLAAATLCYGVAWMKIA